MHTQLKLGENDSEKNIEGGFNRFRPDQSNE